MTTQIRPATPEDVATIHRFVVELAVYEKEPDAVKATEAMLHDGLFGAKPVAEALIAERRGEDGTAAEPIGFAFFYTTFSTWTGRPGLYLEDLYVSPEARGSGVGSQLLAALAGIAVERGCPRVDWAVLDWNQPAIDFYGAIGAMPQDGWTVNRLTGPALQAMAARRSA